MADMQASVILKLIDKLTPGLVKIGRQMNKLDRKQAGRGSQTAARNQARALKAQERAVARLSRGYSKLGRHADKAARAHLKVSRGARRGAREFRRQQADMAKGLRKARNYATAGVGIVLAQAAAAGAAVRNLLLDPAAQFEKFQTTLETTEGSAEKARKAMAWVQDFATRTPFDLEQVMKAFVSLRSQGLDPTNGLLLKLGDAASAMGIDMIQAVEAIKDAVTGENERLKELGITSSVNSKKGIVTYSYTDKDGNEQKKTVKQNRADILAALSEIFSKFDGAMSKQMKTWNGMVSNLGGIFLDIKLMIMKAGLFDWMKGQLREVLDLLEKMKETGELQALAEKISSVLQTSLKAGWEVASTIANVLLQIGSAIDYAANAVGGYENLTQAVLALAGLTIAAKVASGLFAVAKGLKAIMGAAAASGLLEGAVAGGAAGKGGKSKSGRRAKFMAGAGIAGLIGLLLNDRYRGQTQDQRDASINDTVSRTRATPEGQAVEWVKEKAAAAWSQITQTGSDAANSIAETWNTKVAPKVLSAIQSMRDKAMSIDWAGIKAKITADMAGIGESIRATLSRINLHDAGAKILNSLWEGMKAKAAALLNWASGVASRIKGAFSGGGGAAPSGGSMPGSGSPGQSSVVKKRRHGGNFNAGDTLMVGERGTELMTIGRSGTVTPNHALRGGGSRTVNINLGGVTINNADNGAMARLVDQLDRRFRASLHDIEAVT